MLPQPVNHLRREPGRVALCVSREELVRQSRPPLWPNEAGSAVPNGKASDCDEQNGEPVHKRKLRNVLKDVNTSMCFSLEAGPC
jgi:hypothetical protein